MTRPGGPDVPVPTQWCAGPNQLPWPAADSSWPLRQLLSPAVTQAAPLARRLSTGGPAGVTGSLIMMISGFSDVTDE